MKHSARQAARSITGAVGRLAAVLIAAAGFTLALGMIFPVQYTLDTVGYRETAAVTWAPLTASEDELPELREALVDERVTVVADFFTQAVAGDRVVGPVSLWVLLGDDLDADLTLLPEVARVAGSPRDPADLGDWIDISADMARDLAVGPGDTVDVLIGPEESAPLTVRGVYAARENGVAGVAVAPAAAILRHDPATPISATSFVSTADPTTVERLLNSPPWRDRMLSGNYELPIEVEALSAQLTHAEASSFTQLGLVLTVSVLALAALLAIVVAEINALTTTTFRPRAEVLIEMGGRPAAVHLGAALFISAAAAVSLSLGSGLATIAYTAAWAGPTLPPMLTPIWWAATGVAVAVAVATAMAAAHRNRRRATT